MSAVRCLCALSCMLLVGLLTGCKSEMRSAYSPAVGSSESSDRETAAESALEPMAGMPARPDEGRGPGVAGDRYERILENEFRAAGANPLSTFSIDVDSASYAKVRQYLMQQGMMPNPDAVRIEELVNYFVYDYEPPTGEHPFAAHVEVAAAPWRPEHRLVRIGIKGKEIEQERPAGNLVFLLDVSGSMDQPNKLPLLKRGMKMLVDQLGENDRAAIVVYAGAAGQVLDSTSGDEKQTILDALERLQAGGSTNGGEGMRLAYRIALDNFIQGGTNRVLLCTDGDFNVGTTNKGDIVRLAEQHAKAGVFLTVLGFGMGNHNDDMLETLSNKANGNYAFIDSDHEARRVLVEQMNATLVTIAKDVKIQVEFNPAQVEAWRLIGYENRLLAAEDFNDDKKDAGEIGAGHTVTALYEVIPAGAESEVAVADVDELKYQRQGELSEAAQTDELLTLKIRYKAPEEDESTLIAFPVEDSEAQFGAAGGDFQFAAAVASFGMLLRDSQFKGDATYDAVEEIATSALGDDPGGYRTEFIEMVRRATELK
ncbi:MAG: VWA domain-containing protein [Planctomycetes bacterium]|nr:VWA domain-containing protein [Planctomycetota bacterium]